MYENKHTPEPWRTDEECGYPCDIHDALNADLIARAFCDPINDIDGEANARRIVACVNACAGCATEVLETAPVGFFNSAYGHPKYLEEITKQRDELLAALERFMDSHEECTDFDGFTAQIVSMDDYHQAQEAIESVKGEQ